MIETEKEIDTGVIEAEGMIIIPIIPMIILTIIGTVAGRAETAHQEGPIGTIHQSKGEAEKRRESVAMHLQKIHTLRKNTSLSAHQST